MSGRVSDGGRHRDGAVERPDADVEAELRDIRGAHQETGSRPGHVARVDQGLVEAGRSARARVVEDARDHDGNRLSVAHGDVDAPQARESEGRDEIGVGDDLSRSERPGHRGIRELSRDPGGMEDQPAGARRLARVEQLDGGPEERSEVSRKRSDDRDVTRHDLGRGPRGPRRRHRVSRCLGPGRGAGLRDRRARRRVGRQRDRLRDRDGRRRGGSGCGRLGDRLQSPSRWATASSSCGRRHRSGCGRRRSRRRGLCERCTQTQRGEEKRARDGDLPPKTIPCKCECL